MKPDESLEEVERALSVLGGRHPEQVRAEREAAEAVKKRQEAHLAALRVENARRRRRGLVAVLALGALAAGGVVAYRTWATHAALLAEAAPLDARWTALGFDALPRGSFAPEDQAEVLTAPGDCYVVAAARKADITVVRPTGTGGAKGEVLLCTCAAENITAKAQGGASLRMFHIAGGALGGTRALAYRFESSPPTVLAGDDACSEDLLVAFARDHRYGTQAADGAFLSAHPALGASGFTTVASAPANKPYVFVDMSGPARCFIATGAEKEGLEVFSTSDTASRSLRVETALGWCAVKPTTFVVQRDATDRHGALTVVSVPSARIGGVVGLREVARRAGLVLTVHQRDDERGDLAADTLRASVVPDPAVVSGQTIEAAQAKDARVLVFSLGAGEPFTSGDLDVRCEPALGQPESVCVQPRALTWRPPAPTGPSASAAYGPLPYWMSVLDDVHDARVLEVEMTLLALSRRLGALGFAPGVIEGITEKTTTVEILGRSGDDAVIAVGLVPAPPFATPYTDGPAWKLDGEPRVIPVVAGARISLPVGLGAQFAPASRRTVVFRHSTGR